MSDTNLRNLEREFEANPCADTLTAYRQAQMRSGVALGDLKPELEVHLEYEEYKTGGEPEDEGPWANHEDEYCHFDPLALGVTQSKNTWRNESIPVNFLPEVGAEVFFVYVDYDTGSTFGRLRNRWQVVGVVDTQRAVDKLVQAIEDFNKDPDYQGTVRQIKQLTGNQYFYINWDGFFEKYNDTVVVPFTLRG